MGGMSLLSLAVRTARLGNEVILPRTNGTREAGFYQWRMSMLKADLMALDPTEGAARMFLSLQDALPDPEQDFEITDGVVTRQWRDAPRDVSR